MTNSLPCQPLAKGGFCRQEADTLPMTMSLESHVAQTPAFDEQRHRVGIVEGLEKYVEMYTSHASPVQGRGRGRRRVSRRI